jgi:methylmalonyl-CoA mutase cobalamin-binding subunit
MQKAAGRPRVVLATLPGEAHMPGLLMLAGILSSRGIAAINLGGEVPMDQIGQAIRQFRTDIAGITFSGSYPYRTIREHLSELRERLADDVDIWIGGEGVRRLCKLPPGVARFNSLEALPVTCGFPAATHPHRTETV